MTLNSTYTRSNLGPGLTLLCIQTWTFKYFCLMRAAKQYTGGESIWLMTFPRCHTPKCVGIMTSRLDERVTLVLNKDILMRSKISFHHLVFSTFALSSVFVSGIKLHSKHESSNWSKLSSILLCWCQLCYILLSLDVVCCFYLLIFLGMHVQDQDTSLR